MRCVNLQQAKYVDLRGRTIWYERPCGHCLACLHNQQDSWSIRITETANHHNFFVYDTLTFRPSALTFIDVTDVCSCPKIEISQESQKLLDLYRDLDEYTGEVRYLSPAIDRSVLQGWIKRARENFYLDNGYRPKWKYFIVEEYGPKTSRPHIHLLWWGISKEDYIKYLGKPWSRDYGARKPHYKFGTDKDRRCIARYISKYVSKGVFESPLVLDGLSPKPFRSISHGIGEELLLLSCYDRFRTPKCEYLKQYRVIKSDRDLTRHYVYRLLEAGAGNEVPSYSKDDLRYLTTYYDNLGVPHALPRYYRTKLLKLDTPNVYSATVQALLLENSRLHYNQKIQEFARTLGYQPDVGKVQSATAGFGRELYHLLCGQYTIIQNCQAKANAVRCYDKLKNHYGRAMNIAIS